MDNPKKFASKGKVGELLENGLEGFGSRHEAQYNILNYLWSKNSFEKEAIEFVWRWIMKKHNGYSKEINKGNWREVKEEIKRQGAWIWKRHRYLPDAPHNLQGKAYKSDLRHIGEVFPGDAVRQKQYFSLLSYYRAREHHEYVFVSKRMWTEIAHEKNYLRLQRDLEAKGLMEANRQYKVNEYSRRYKLYLPTPKEAEPIQVEERNIDEYYEALKVSYKSKREIQELTGINKMTIWRNLM
jgi:hypothetical protein